MIALGGPGKWYASIQRVTASCSAKSASTRLGDIARVQPRRRPSGFDTPQRRALRLGSIHRARISVAQSYGAITGLVAHRST